MIYEKNGNIGILNKMKTSGFNSWKLDEFLLIVSNAILDVK